MVAPTGGYSEQQVRTFAAAAAEPKQSQTDVGQERGDKVAERVPRTEVDISRKVDVARSLVGEC